MATAAARRKTTGSATPGGWAPLGGVALAAAIAVALTHPWPRPAPPPARTPSADEARASNAAVPIDPSRRRRAAPYRFAGGVAAREQATECLATAALYEAGDDPRGQRAVIQVVLNRVRAAGFPPTVCGVVYEGRARATGCQFSFTCDGSFDRRPIHLGWPRARRAAAQALRGRVFAAVGTATHYHADWMVPYWRDTMTKVARVGDHLFYARGVSPMRRAG